MSEYQWKTVSVVAFDELMQALDRADRKGYMPDAIKEEWEAFNWKPEQPAQQEPVAWMVYTLDGKSVFVTDNPADFTPDHRALPLYTSPPAQRTWVGLSEEEKQEWIDAMPYDIEPRHCMILLNVMEVQLKQRNT